MPDLSQVLPSFPNTWSAIQTFNSGNLSVTNPAKTFAYTILGAAIGANCTLTLPLITSNDTLAALNVAQTWTQTQIFAQISRFDALGVFYLGAYIGSANQSVLSSTGLMSRYNTIFTAAWGLPAIYAAGLRVSIGTTSTAVCSFTPAAIGSFEVKWRIACKASTTPTLTLTYTDPDAGAQPITLASTAMTTGQVLSGTYPLVSSASVAIALAGTALIAGDIIVTAEITELQ